MSHKDWGGDGRYGDRCQQHQQQQQQKEWGVQKTSVGLHSRGVITAIPVGNTSALPAGSPSGGVRVGAGANTTETDVQPGGGGGCFFFFFSPSDRRSPLCLLPVKVGQGEGQKITEEHWWYLVATTTETPECRALMIDQSYLSSSQISFQRVTLPPPPSSALRLRSTRCCLYPMLLAVVAGSFTSLLPGPLPWFPTSSSVACHSAGSPGSKGNQIRYSWANGGLVIWEIPQRSNFYWQIYQTRGYF